MSLENQVSSSERVESGDDPIATLDSPHKRSWTRVFGGIGVVLLGALIGAYAFVASSPEMSTVMVADGELAAGEPIDAGDLRAVEVGAVEGLDVVRPDQQDSLLGLTPRVPIPDGTLLNDGFFVAADEAIPVGKVVVGAVLEPGSAPLDRLRVGDPVGLIAIGSTTATDAQQTEVIGDAQVWAIDDTGEQPGAENQVWLSLLVDQDLQTGVAQAAADSNLWVTALGASS